MIIHGASLVAQLVKNLPAMWETRVQSLNWEDPWRRAWKPTPVFLPGESPGTEEPGGLYIVHAVTNLAATVHGVAKSQTGLSTLTIFNICPSCNDFPK